MDPTIRANMLTAMGLMTSAYRRLLFLAYYGMPGDTMDVDDAGIQEDLIDHAEANDRLEQLAYLITLSIRSQEAAGV